ncbi:unnamed protein product [Clavelina lepadiformis]|uniref:Uncharacterized protein n=1 Tax=Clavelina lepadiformis TaxID=159417 RepID=A0ABP0H1M2_CLALP
MKKTALVISTNISGSNDNKGESVPGTNGSFCDITQEDASTPVIRRHSLARSVLTKLPESRRMDRKGSHESTDSNAIVTNLKKRRQTVKIKPKKTKQVTSTTVTFSLSGDGPKENSTGKVHDEEKPKRNIMPKKFHLRNFSKQSVLKPAQNV